MISNAIANSLTTERPVLVTGSNASGKSTFLKAIALNAILAQSLHTCLSRSYSSPLFAVMTSMALRDSIRNGESYFIAEIKSIKRIFDFLNSKLPCLCLIDEVLRGTNTIERIAASSQVLLQLAGKNSICIAATHDIELTYILEQCYRNVHFQETIAENGVVFDYKLQEGRSTSRNATVPALSPKPKREPISFLSKDAGSELEGA
jgi:DNA mismatch repair ATPase MutS